MYVTFSPIMTVVAVTPPDVISGITDASATRRFGTPITLNCAMDGWWWCSVQLV